MPILIDGWNLIRDERSAIADDEALESARALILYLEDFQRTHNDPIIVVFDSKNAFLDIGYRNTEKLSVVPTKDADKFLKKYIEAVPERQRRNLRVVSSDNSVYFHAKSYYAMPIRSAEFWAKLRARRRAP